MAGLIKYESLKDGSIDALDLARLNEALDVEAINTERLREYYEQQQARRRNG